ncbi:MAG: glycoside hydrolase family 27 protein [Verrucomicrobiota bacterium JB022]|nr:glycoside hydrolase family 27 protein [Verrucomicrobiota bacterium JB022]
MKLRLPFAGALLALACLLPAAQAQKFEGLAQTPPMGWNSWNTFETHIDEELVKDVAQAMIDSGMRDAGYNYIVLDDGWMAMERDEEGNLVADPNKFPSGMKALGDYLHEHGFKFGLYNCAGSKTCAGYPGSQGHEFQDARNYASWGVDYLKYDWCFTEGRDAKEAYTTMSRALKKAGRPVVFSLCEWGQNQPWKWAKGVGHLWRTSGDIIDCYDCVERWSHGWKVILDIQMDREEGHEGLEKYAGPGHWNDPDMLEVGNPGLTVAESRAHFSLWCMIAAPLIAGNDVRNMSEPIRQILTNREAIAIDQDKAGKQGWRFSQDGEREIWVRELSEGDWAVCVLNASDDRRATALDFERLYFIPGDYQVRDIWAAQDLGLRSELKRIERTLEPHDVIFLRLNKVD